MKGLKLIEGVENFCFDCRYSTIIDVNSPLHCTADVKVIGKDYIYGGLYVSPCAPCEDVRDGPQCGKFKRKWWKFWC
jgi:hypothetical protein